MFYNLPSVLKRHIFEYDDTYRIKYDEVMEKIESKDTKMLRKLFFEEEDEVEKITDEGIDRMFIITYENEEQKSCHIRTMEQMEELKDEIIYNDLWKADVEILSKYLPHTPKVLIKIQKLLSYPICNEELFNRFPSKKEWEQYKDEVDNNGFELYQDEYDLVWFCDDSDYKFLEDDIFLCFNEIN